MKKFSAKLLLWLIFPCLALGAGSFEVKDGKFTGAADFSLLSNKPTVLTQLGAEKITNRGVANGYATLDSTVHVPLSQIAFAAPIINTLGVLTLQNADSTHTGALTFGDWVIFNGKEGALGNPSVTGQHLVSTTGGVRSWSSNIIGNAATATALQNARNINGVSFDGTANITVTAAAGTLTGTILNASVVTSSLTSVGTIATGVWNGTVITGTYGGTGVNNGSKTITLGANLTTTGTSNTVLAFPSSGTPTYTFPAASQTLASLAGTETLTNKNLSTGNTFPTFNQDTTGNAATATALQNARTIGGVSFDGTANITVSTATGGFTISGGNLALSTNSITMTGSIGSTGSRVTKGWFTDIESTNAIVASITGSAPTLTTSRNIGGASFNGSASISLDAITGLSGTGVIARTAANTLTPRTITGTSNQITLTNGDGVSGNPTISIPALAQLSIAKLTNLTGNGFVKTSAGDGTLSVDTNTYLTGNQSITVSGDATGSGATSISLTITKINGTSLAGLVTGILKNTTGTGVPSIAVPADFPTLNQNTTGSAATLTNSRSIHGGSFNGSADVTNIIASTYGGTGNGFTKFSGPTTSEKTKTLRDANDTILELGGTYNPTGVWTFASNVNVPALTATAQITGVGVRSATGGGFTAATSGGVDVFSVNGTTGAVTSSGVIKAADYTIGVTGSYYANVVFEGDSITQQVANLGFSETVTTTSGSATVTTSGSISKTVTTTNASPTVTTAGNFSDVKVGWPISGTGIPASSYVGIINSATSIGLSSSPYGNVPVNATASGSITASITRSFTEADLGSSISGTGIPASSYIGAINSSTSISLSSDPLQNTPVNATGSASVTATIVPYGYNNYMGLFAGSSPENFTAAALGTYNGIAVFPPNGYNVAVAGQTVQQLYETSWRVNNKFRQEAGLNVLVYLAGTNNMGLSPYETPQQTYSHIAAACRQYRAQGWKVVLVGLISRGGNQTGTGTAFNTLVATVNSYLRQNWTQFADRYVDWNATVNGASNEFQSITGTAYSNTTWYNVDQLHPTYAGERKLAYYIAPYVNDLLALYFQNQSNQLYVNVNKTTHDSIYTTGMLTLNNENPTLGQNEINFAFNKIVKENIRGDYNGNLTLGATGYVALTVHPSGPDGTEIYAATSGADTGERFYTYTDRVESVRPMRVTSNAGAGFTTGKGLELNYSSGIDYATITSYDRTSPAWKPLLIQSSTIKFATSGTDRVFITSVGDIGLAGVAPLGNNYGTTLGRGQVNILMGTDAGGDIHMLSNAHYDNGTWRYSVSSHGASDILAYEGEVWFRTAASGTLNNALTWSQVFTLKNNGGLRLGTGSIDPLAGNIAIGTASAKGGVLWLGNDGTRYLEWNAGVSAYNLSGASLYVNGTVYSSSREVKQNITSASLANRRLTPKRYQYKDKPDQIRYGFVAEEVKEVLPEAVMEAPADPKDPKAKRLGIDPMVIIAKHEQEIQELQDQLSNLVSSNPLTRFAPSSPPSVQTPLKNEEK